MVEMDLLFILVMMSPGVNVPLIAGLARRHLGDNHARWSSTPYCAAKSLVSALAVKP